MDNDNKLVQKAADLQALPHKLSNFHEARHEQGRDSLNLHD